MGRIDIIIIKTTWLMKTGFMNMIIIDEGMMYCILLEPGPTTTT